MQKITPVSSSLTINEFGTPQVLKDLLQEATGYILSFGDLTDLRWLTLIMKRNIEQCEERVSATVR